MSIFWYTIYWTFLLLHIPNAPYPDRTIRSLCSSLFLPNALIWCICLSSSSLLLSWGRESRPHYDSFLLQGESELDTPFVIPYLLCQIVLIFAKLNRPRKCWRWCLSRFVYIFPWLLNSLQNYLANSLSWGIYLRYRERTWNGFETDLKRRWNGGRVSEKWKIKKWKVKNEKSEFRKNKFSYNSATRHPQRCKLLRLL